MNIVFYYGTDSFRVREAMEKKIVDFRVENKEGVVEKLDFEKGDDCRGQSSRLEEVENILKRRSFFDEPELLVVYACLSAKDLQKKDDKLFKFLNKKAEEIKEFESIKGSALEKWALEKVIQTGFSIKLPVLKKLLSRVVLQEQLGQEIEKLMAFQNFHQKNEIDNQAVEILVKSLDLEVGNFVLIDAIGARDIKKAVTFLNQTLSEGTEPQTVLGQIIYQFRNLLRVKSLHLGTGFPSGETVVRLTGLHPFVARKTSQQIKQFELEELKKIYRRLSELDIQSKTGQIDLPTGLFQLILGI